jgi:N-acetylneuraminate synthase
LRASTNLGSGTVLRPEMLEALRPAPRDAVMPFDLPRVMGKTLIRDLPAGEYLKWNMLAGVGEAR